MIWASFRKHYNSVIFNPIFSSIDIIFTPNNVYYNDRMHINCQIEALKKAKIGKILVFQISYYIKS